MSFTEGHNTKACRRCGQPLNHHSIYGLQCCIQALMRNDERAAMERQLESPDQEELAKRMRNRLFKEGRMKV